MLRYLFENKKNKGAKKQNRNFWVFGLGEFVLIFLGILIALQVDNWNQNRQERKLETVLLNEMLDNLQDDLKTIVTDFNLHKTSLSSHQIVLAFLEGEEPWHDSLAAHFGYLNEGTIFNENMSAYESLKSIGIDLISNDSIRQHLTHLYSVRYDYILTMEQLLQKQTMEIMNPAISEHLYTIDFHEKAVPLDVAKIKASNGFRHAVKLDIKLSEYLLDSYVEAKQQIIKLVEEIEEELN